MTDQTMRKAVERAVDVAITQVDSSAAPVDAKGDPDYVSDVAVEKVGEFLTKEQWSESYRSEEQLQSMVENELRRQL